MRYATLLLGLGIAAAPAQTAPLQVASVSPAANRLSPIYTPILVTFDQASVHRISGPNRRSSSPELVSTKAGQQGRSRGPRGAGSAGEP